jgi:imidazole glycerol-phosphate synthase subunit HisH
MGSIAIIDYGIGNLRSIQKALEYLGFSAEITGDRKTITVSDGIILPGVGAFPTAMEKLVSSGIDKTIYESVKLDKPILGICLGMQLLFQTGYEVKKCEGLGLLKGSVKKIKGNLKVPHMGWNKLNIDKGSPLFKDIEEGSYVYFVHSFYAELKERRNLIASTYYGSSLTAAVCEGKIFGVQFHPEKSGEIGLTMLKNFGEMIV